MRDLVTTYARQVVKGKVPCGALHRAACARHLRDLEERRARGLVWEGLLREIRIAENVLGAGHYMDLERKVMEVIGRIHMLTVPRGSVVFF